MTERETPAQLFFCEFVKFFKIAFYGTPLGNCRRCIQNPVKHLAWYLWRKYFSQTVPRGRCMAGLTIRLLLLIFLHCFSKFSNCVEGSQMQSLSPKACKFIKKETLTQMLSYEFCKISKNTFSYRTPPMLLLKRLTAFYILWVECVSLPNLCWIITFQLLKECWTR